MQPSTHVVEPTIIRADATLFTTQNSQNLIGTAGPDIFVIDATDTPGVGPIIDFFPPSDGVGGFNPVLDTIALVNFNAATQTLLVGNASTFGADAFKIITNGEDPNFGETVWVQSPITDVHITFYAGDPFRTIFGDLLLPNPLSGNLHAGNQTLGGPNNLDNSLVGDVDTITDHARGGDDHLVGGNLTTSGVLVMENDLFGDAHTMSGSAQGGNNILTGGDASNGGTLTNMFYGAAQTMSDRAGLGNLNRAISGVSA